MKWIQDNPFIAGLAAVAIAGAGALAFLVSQAMTQHQEYTDAYVQAVQKLHGLQNRSPFPNQANLDKSRALADEYKTQLKTLREQLTGMEVPINPDVKPQQFQDDLRTTVNEIAEKAAAAGVELPKDFYLGFGQYANTLPSERAAPALDRQLTIISQIVGRVIDFKVKSIDGLERRLLPEESPAPPENQRKQEVLLRYPFDIAFTAEQAKFRVILNSLLTADHFLILRALSVQNSDPAGPPIAQANNNQSSPANTGATSPDGTNTPAAVPGLEVILGREFVKATARVEIIDFAEPEEAKK